jgi:hypothetical protein
LAFWRCPPLAGGEGCGLGYLRCAARERYKVSGSPQRARRAYSEVDPGGLDLRKLVSELIYRMQALKVLLRNS